MILRLILLTLLSFCTLFAAQFSADMHMSNPERQLNVDGKLNVDGEKMRQEIHSPYGTQVTIIRPDKKVLWTLMPSNKMYQEMHYDQSTEEVQEWDKKALARTEYLGTEKVSGLTCKKYRVKEEGHIGLIWMNDNYPMPIKVQSSDGSTMTYSNIKMGKQKNSLFEPPKGYKKMAMPDMGNMQQMQQMQEMEQHHERSKAESYTESKAERAEERTKTKADDKVDESIDEAVDKGMEKLFDKLF